MWSNNDILPFPNMLHVVMSPVFCFPAQQLYCCAQTTHGLFHNDLKINFFCGTSRECVFFIHFSNLFFCPVSQTKLIDVMWSCLTDIWQFCLQEVFFSDSTFFHLCATCCLFTDLLWIFFLQYKCFFQLSLSFNALFLLIFSYARACYSLRICTKNPFFYIFLSTHDNFLHAPLRTVIEPEPQ